VNSQFLARIARMDDEIRLLQEELARQKQEIATLKQLIVEGKYDRTSIAD
jgi:hypothetical protein